MPGSISTLVPTYNRGRFLSDAIAALQAQTRPVSEIIIWDDGSTDETPAIAADLISADPNSQIRYFRSENGGKSAALNAALEKVGGDYIWICDDDDIVRPDAAERMAHALDHGDAGLVGGRHIRFSQDEASGEKTFADTGYWPDLSSGSVIRHMLEDIFFFQNASLVRRSCFAVAGPFRTDLSRSIDYDMFVRLGTRFPIEIVQGVLFEQRKHDGARGPAAQRHDAEQSESVWQANDRAIFAQLRPVLPLAFYAAFFDAASGKLALRAGLLQRGCVYARRGDWNSALEDFHAAAHMLHNEPLTRLEMQIVGRAMAAKHFNSSVFEPPLRGRLLALAGVDAAGPQIVRALGRGAVWRARAALQSGEALHFLQIGQFCLRATLRPAPPPSPLSLHERDHLKAEAYAW